MMRKTMVIPLFIGEWISLFAAIKHFFVLYFGFINKLFSNLMITLDKEIDFRTSRKFYLLVLGTLTGRYQCTNILWNRQTVVLIMEAVCIFSSGSDLLTWLLKGHWTTSASSPFFCTTIHKHGPIFPKFSSVHHATTWKLWKMSPSF